MENFLREFEQTLQNLNLQGLEFEGVLPIVLVISGLVVAAVLLVYIVSFWLIFNKAGRRGWLVLIPLVNIIVLLRIAGKPVWYLLLFWVPLLNVILFMSVWIDLAHAFGKKTGFGVCLWFFNIICVAILAFDGSAYRGGGQEHLPSVGLNMPLPNLLS